MLPQEEDIVVTNQRRGWLVVSRESFRVKVCCCLASPPLRVVLKSFPNNHRFREEKQQCSLACTLVHRMAERLGHPTALTRLQRAGQQAQRRGNDWGVGEERKMTQWGSREENKWEWHEWERSVPRGEEARKCECLPIMSQHRSTS